MTGRIAIVAVLTACLAAGGRADDDKKNADKGKKGPDAVQKYIKEQDKNNDGSLSRDELPAGQRDGFEDVDSNHDGKLSAQELRDHAKRMVFVPVPVPVEVVSMYVLEAGNDTPTLEQVQDTYAMLRKADANNDGTITKEEAEAAREHAVQKRIDSVFKRCDKNGDGKLGKDECPDGMAGLFSRADKDNDGAVTKDELKACCTPSGKGDQARTESDKK